MCQARVALQCSGAQHERTGVVAGPRLRFLGFDFSGAGDWRTKMLGKGVFMLGMCRCTMQRCAT